MITVDSGKIHSSAQTLVDNHVASRVFAKDASLYDYSENARDFAENYMGWTSLGVDPECDIDDIVQFADEVVASGIKNVVLLGQGGSSQAPMTYTKYNKANGNRVNFRVLDSDSAVRMRQTFEVCRPEETLFIVSSKSGGTIEPRMMLAAVTDHYKPQLGADFHKHLVAITDPGSNLEKQASEEGWLKIFSGIPQVGGRFSALSVFGLVPAAIAGIDIRELLKSTKNATEAFSRDELGNPAIDLAAMLYGGYLEGRNKIAFLSPKRGRTLGLWIEQLVAESLGKEGEGILPYLEMDPLFLTKDAGDRMVVTYRTATEFLDETRDFEAGAKCIDAGIPRRDYALDGVADLAEHFLLWEYATAMCGYLMKVSPFDQPDVQSTKTAVLGILADGVSTPDYTVGDFGKSYGASLGALEVRQSQQFKECDKLEDTLFQLFKSIEPGDYFAINAFLPFVGQARRDALEGMRRDVAKHFGIPSCLEIGPRYLHSTGQMQKGGPNCGVFLTISSDEIEDIKLPEGSEATSLEVLGKAQAVGDMETLASRGRRAVSVHLPNSCGVTLQMLANIVHKAACRAHRAQKADC